MKNIHNSGIPSFLSLLVFIILLNTGISAQERIQPNKGYQAGETIESPLYGIKLELPDHWNGFLTRNTEVFTLNSDTTLETSIMIFPSEEDLQAIERRWNGKVELSPGMELIAADPPRINGGKLKSEFTFSGDETRMGYSIAQCGDFGFCYTAFLIISKSKGPYYRGVLDKLSENIGFFEPTLASLYDDYSWAEKLKGKYLVTYESAGYSVKQNHLWLCEDGTFQARIKRKGGFKGSTGKHKGKLKGTYQIEGVGANGKVLLNFEKQSPLELPLEIKDDVVYMNGLRYSISEHNQCK